MLGWPGAGRHTDRDREEDGDTHRHKSRGREKASETNKYEIRSWDLCNNDITKMHVYT